MNFDRSLELQLEILTLLKNVEKFNELGWSTASLKNRLEICRSQLSELKSASTVSFHPLFIEDQRNSCCV